MATVAGQMLTTNVLSDQVALDLGDRITLLEPSANPLTVFTKAVEKRATVATKFSWVEDQAKARFDAINNSGGYNSSATSIVVDNGAYFQQWDLVLVTRTMEQFRVDSVSTNTLTVTRGIGSTAAAINDNDELYLVGSAQPEGDTSKPPASDIPSKVTNNTQIIRNPWAISGTAMEIGYQLSPNEWDRQQRNKGIDHAKDIELSLLFGGKSATTPGSSEVRTTSGVLRFITTNQTDAGGDLSEAEWNAFMMQVMRFGSGQKLALASGVAMQALQKFPAGKLQVRQDETTYGINVSHFTGPFGDVNVVYHRLLEGTKFSGYLIVVDMDNVAYRYVTNRDTRVKQNIQENDRDGRKDELITEMGLECRMQRTHGVLTGITS